MGKKLTNKQAEELGFSLYMNEDLTQKEIAKRVGRSVVTVNKWVAKGQWEEKKQAYYRTSEEQLKIFTTQLAALNRAIEERDDKYPTSKEADIQIKLTKAIQLFKGEADIADLIAYNKRFTRFLRANYPQKLKEITQLLNEFLHNEL